MKPFSGKSYIYMPIVFASLIVVGMFVGRALNFGSTGFSDVKSATLTADESFKKIGQVLRYINTQYVDTINYSQLTEKTVNDLLQNLDPHSVYISATDLNEVNEGLEGNFYGIGIEFNLFNDTIRVISVISGGPAAQAGILSGDKIIKVDNEIVAGTQIKTRDVFKKLRGEEGTKVKVLVLRSSASNAIEYTLTRGEIPLYSVDASYMLGPNVGYIKISRFAEKTYTEFMEAAAKLQHSGMQQLVIDLRGNGGGLLDVAVQIADEFLEKGKLIVFTEGKSSPKKNHTATSTGKYEATPLYILIDENSASASEIIAGTMQDNDRATIVGRKSFGKGLVQNQFELPDGSAIRLTVARYYTPTGRCIQKSYANGTEKYYNDEESYAGGELLNKDSIHFPDSLKYKTPKGKIVYGGGGIMPDVFVPLDTSNQTDYFNALYYKGVVSDFCFRYADNNRSDLSAKGMDVFIKNFTVSEKMIADFAAFAQQQGVEKKNNELNRALPILKKYLKSGIARNVWGNKAFYPIFNSDDNTIQQTMLTISSGNMQ
jgi:carboxyl-terminal processing protease